MFVVVVVRPINVRRYNRVDRTAAFFFLPTGARYTVISGTSVVPHPGDRSARKIFDLRGIASNLVIGRVCVCV